MSRPQRHPILHALLRAVFPPSWLTPPAYALAAAGAYLAYAAGQIEQHHGFDAAGPYAAASLTAGELGYLLYAAALHNATRRARNRTAGA